MPSSANLEQLNSDHSSLTAVTAMAAAEADVHTRAKCAMPQLVIAGVIKAAFFFVPIVERQRVWVERAPDYFRIVGSGWKNRQIHIVENRRGGSQNQNVAQACIVSGL